MALPRTSLLIGYFVAGIARCIRCQRRCTRHYLPLQDTSPPCRRCWDSPALLAPSTTAKSRSGAAVDSGACLGRLSASGRSGADERRFKRPERSRERWDKRRSILTRTQSDRSEGAVAGLKSVRQSTMAELHRLKGRIRPQHRLPWTDSLELREATTNTEPARPHREEPGSSAPARWDRQIGVTSCSSSTSRQVHRRSTRSRQDPPSRLL